MTHVFKKGTSLFVVLLLLIAVNIALVGGFHFADSMSANGHMSDCPLKDVATICPMSPLEHILAWQSALTTILKTGTEMSLLLLALILARTLTSPWVTRRMQEVRDATHSAILVHIRPRLDTPVVFRALQEDFSRGILNPKLF